ncbi:tautomerase family protein [Streptomyces sp. WMMC500]|uniref:tautomerase family protein n=1 Tax=Streptomyces sp. WMMC500 TaxID=3015154 RepID=UPI00248C0A71|nr:tautomerase family protein [Streptomyces sp. WMMC500]WBB58923.1 tautomerase family protein [Streptomyces sp. WMMC500]
MPVIHIDGPAGLPQSARQKLVREVTRAADEAYHVPDVRIWLRETPADGYAQDGELGARIRPVATLQVPELSSIDARRTLVGRVNAALADAYAGLADTENVIVFLDDYPLERVGWAGRLQSDVPEMVTLAERLAG